MKNENIRKELLVLKEIAFLASRSNVLKTLFLGLILSLLLSNSFEKIVKNFNSFRADVSTSYLHMSDFNKTQAGTGWSNILHYIKEKTEQDAIFLLFRNAEFPLYTKRKHITYLDPRMVNVYQSENETTLYTRLKDLNISYIYVPPYPNAVRSNTLFSTFLNNPAYTTLLMESHGYRLYKIKTSPDFSYRFDFSRQLIHTPATLMHAYTKYKQYKRRLYSPLMKIDDASAYLIDVTFSGKGNIKLVVNETNASGVEFLSTPWALFHADANTTIHSRILYKPSLHTVKAKFVYIPENDQSEITSATTRISKLAPLDTSAVRSWILQIDLDRANYFVTKKTKAEKGKQYYIASDIAGKGIVYLYAKEYNILGRPLGSKYINAIFTQAKTKKKSFSGLYIPSKDAAFFQLAYQRTEDSNITVYNHTVYAIDYPKDVCYVAQ